MFQSTHPRRVTVFSKVLVTVSVVSIHTPTQGVTMLSRHRFSVIGKFQSTHPRRV